jgi:predicted Zn-dependent protease
MDATTALAPSPSHDGASQIEQEVERIRGLQNAGRHPEALAAAEVLLHDLPENRDLLLAAATSLRCQMRIDEALATLDRLGQTHPRFSRLHQERGLAYVALRDAPRAIESLLRAVNINPALPMSWRMLEGVYRLTGELDNAATAAAHVATLKALPPEVVTATSLFSDGDLTPAEQIVRAYLLQHGDHPEAMRLLAKIGVARDVLDDAEMLLEAVLILAPDHRAARYEYAQTLVLRHKYAQANAQIQGLLTLEPQNPDYRVTAATAAVGLGDHDTAIIPKRCGSWPR